MVTGDGIKSLLRENLYEALQSRKPVDNVKGWRRKAADDLGVSLATFDNWLYGPTPNNPDSSLPSLENWVALCLYFPGLDVEVLAGVLPGAQRGPDLRSHIRRLRSDIDSIHRRGVHVKDLGRGLLDFPARREGRSVLLCWRVGEASLEFWHETAEGYAGRRKVTDDGLWEEG